MINWDKVTFRASSWGNLLAESKTKGEVVGKTCAAELIKIYNLVKYGRKKEIVTKAMTKGILVEPEAIALYSLLEGRMYYKNEVRLENEYFSGHPDVADHEDIMQAMSVDDIKCSWELDSFMPKLLEEPDKGYAAQLNAYYDLTGAQGGSIVYCLVDCPESVLMDEKRKLLYAMDVISDESPEYKAAEKELIRNLTFKDIHYTERVIKKYVPRDEELIEKMKSKVPIFREWLRKFEILHTSRYPKHNEIVCPTTP